MAAPHIGYVIEATYRVFYGDTVKAIEHWLAQAESEVLQLYKFVGIVWLRTLPRRGDLIALLRLVNYGLTLELETFKILAQESELFLEQPRKTHIGRCKKDLSFGSECMYAQVIEK